MGLFGSKKKEEAPAPPAPMPAPPELVGAQAAPDFQADQNMHLSSPPIPGNLDGIKSQVTGDLMDNNSSELSTASNSDGNSNNVQENSEDSANLVDSLFDFSDFELPNSNSESGEIKKFGSKSPSSHSGSMALATSSFKKRDPSIASSETFFITTSQFKHFLDTVEVVRRKVKDASERHLRLLDIKGEEDVEFENLRKDFQYIEDKLYEIDSSIFER